MLNFCKETLVGTEAVEALTLRWLASVCAPDATPLIRSEKVAEWFIPILPMKTTQSLFLWDMLPICNSPNADVSKIRWTIAVKDDIDFLLLSFNVFLAKEERSPLSSGCSCFLSHARFTEDEKTCSSSYQWAHKEAIQLLSTGHCPRGGVNRLGKNHPLCTVTPG